MSDSLDKEFVINELESWKSRLQATFATLTDWAKEFRGDAVSLDTSEITKRPEPLMTQFGVGPFKVPAMSILWDKHRITFVPTNLWVSGTAGVISVVVSRGAMYHLVLLFNDETQNYEWTLFLAADRRRRDILTKERFFALMGEAEKALEASLVHA